MPSQIPEGGIRGWIIPIGGGEEKDDNPQILHHWLLYSTVGNAMDGTFLP